MDDDALFRAFASSTLPAEAWTHEAHLRIAWLCSRDCSLDEAHLRMRVGIVRLNAFHGLVETPDRGYHETLTRFWLGLVRSLRSDSRASTSEAFVVQHAEALRKDAPLRYYSRELLMSLRARAVFVEADLLPTPGGEVDHQAARPPKGRTG